MKDRCELNTSAQKICNPWQRRRCRPKTRHSVATVHRDKGKELKLCFNYLRLELINSELPCQHHENGIDSKCRYCDNKLERVDCLTSGCNVLAPLEYKSRHDRVSHYRQWMTCRHYEVITTDKRYKHHHETVTKGGK